MSTLERSAASDVQASPDLAGRGLLETALDPLRYDSESDDPREVAGLMRAFMPSGVRVLDIGCGTGSITLIVNRDKGNDVVAVEPDADRAALARSRGLNVECVFVDPEFFQRHGQFDVIMFADVIEHLQNPSELLQLAASGLKPGGLILASVPNVAHWTVRLNLLAGRFDYAESGIMDVTHMRWFSARSFRTFFERNGFEVLALREAAGTWLPIYSRSIFKLIPGRWRLIHLFVKLFPSLFGSQHVVKVRAVK